MSEEMIFVRVKEGITCTCGQCGKVLNIENKTGYIDIETAERFEHADYFDIQKSINADLEVGYTVELFSGFMCECGLFVEWLNVPVDSIFIEE